MNRKQRLALGVGVTTALALGATGCGDKVKEPFNDASRSKTQIRLTWTPVPAPDGFKNSVTTCLVLPDGTHTHVRMFRGFNKDESTSTFGDDVIDPIGCP